MLFRNVGPSPNYTARVALESRVRHSVDTCIPSVSRLSCRNVQTLAAVFHSTLLQIRPKCLVRVDRTPDMFRVVARQYLDPQTGYHGRILVFSHSLGSPVQLVMQQPA
jgi:hypothetical protein